MGNVTNVQVNCTLDNSKITNLKTGVYYFIVSFKTICNVIKNSTGLLFGIVNLKPIIEYTSVYYDGNYASNKLNISINCRHVTVCYLFCKLKLSNETVEPEFKNCSNNFVPNVQLVNGLNYTFEIISKDLLENSDRKEFSFIADTQPPSFVNFVDELSGTCGDNLEGTPTVVDNYDPRPVLSFKDTKLTSCLIKREWQAVDSVRNDIKRNQTLIYKSNSRLLFRDSIIMPCINNKQVLNDLNLYKGFITLDENKCNTSLKLSLSYTNIPVDDCDFTFTASWKIEDECNADNNINLEQNVIVEQRQIPYSPLYEQDLVELMPYFKWPIKRNAVAYTLVIRNSEQNDEIGMN